MFRKYIHSLNSGIRLGQFVSVGFVGFLIDNAVLISLVEFGGWRPEIAKILAAEAAIIVMFTLNERWTFSSFGAKSGGAILRRFLKSNLVRVGGVTVSVIVLFILHTGLGIWYVAANIVGIGFGFLVNYTFESLYTWRIYRGS